MFDLAPLKLVALLVLAVLIFGPDKLPKLIADATRMLRAVREFSDKAKQDIREELGPEFQDFELEDLNPKTFVRKQLAVHGEALGLKDVQELKDGFTKEAARATATVRSVRADPLAKVASDGAPADAAVGASAGAYTDAT